MTLLTISGALALDVGIEVPTAVAASTGRDQQEILSYVNAAAVEIAGRVAWGDLTEIATVTGDGTSAAKTVHAAAMFLVEGVTVIRGSDGGFVRPLTRAEWTMTAVQGTPRYFLKEGVTISLWPYLANAATVTVPYQTKNWCSNGTDAFAADSETALFPEDVLIKGLITRWRRQKGMPYQDYEAEYEATIARYAGFDDRGRL